MTEQEAIKYLENNEERTTAARYVLIKNMALQALKAMAELKKRNITHENLENYILFEDECIKYNFTLKSLLEARAKQIPQKPLNVHPHVDHKSGNCPCCEIRLAHFGDMNYCHRCGIKLDWEDAEDAKQ